MEYCVIWLHRELLHVTESGEYFLSLNKRARGWGNLMRLDRLERAFVISPPVLSCAGMKITSSAIKQLLERKSLKKDVSETKCYTQWCFILAFWCCLVLGTHSRYVLFSIWTVFVCACCITKVVKTVKYKYWTSFCHQFECVLKTIWLEDYIQVLFSWPLDVVRLSRDADVKKANSLAIIFFLQHRGCLCGYWIMLTICCIHKVWCKCGCISIALFFLNYTYSLCWVHLPLLTRINSHPCAAK